MTNATTNERTAYGSRSDVEVMYGRPRASPMAPLNGITVAADRRIPISAPASPMTADSYSTEPATPARVAPIILSTANSLFLDSACMEKRVASTMTARISAVIWKTSVYPISDPICIVISPVTSPDTTTSAPRLCIL